jgi:hypothetical protein
VWLRPGAGFELQASYGFLHNPERLFVQDVRKTTVSGSWTNTRGDDYTAITAAFGRNDRDFSESDAYLVEGTHRFKRNVLYGRWEWVEVESEHLLFPGFIHPPHLGERIDVLRAFTIGGLRDVAKVAGFELGVGGDVLFYEVPPLLRRAYYREDPDELDGHRPISFHIFFRIRPPVSAMGRMFNQVMTRGMRH